MAGKKIHDSETKIHLIQCAKKEFMEKVTYSYPEPNEKIYTLKDALKKGELFDKDVPKSSGQKYPKRKKSTSERHYDWQETDAIFR